MSNELSRYSTTDDRNRRRSHSHHSRERKNLDDDVDGSSPLIPYFTAKHA